MGVNRSPDSSVLGALVSVEFREGWRGSEGESVTDDEEGCRGENFIPVKYKYGTLIIIQSF